MKIGQYIYSSRKRKGISQEELANLLEVSRQSISLWETDQTIPTLDKLHAMAKILDVSLDELTGVQSLKQEVNINRKVLSKEELQKIIEKNHKGFEKVGCCHHSFRGKEKRRYKGIGLPYRKRS